MTENPMKKFDEEAVMTALCKENRHHLYTTLVSGNIHYANVWTMKIKLTACSNCQDFTDVNGEKLCIEYLDEKYRESR